MADYKDYIVNYNINANTATAAEGIDKLAASAKAAAEWLAPVEKGMRDIARQAKVLSASANTRFTPTIDTATFNSQLRLMVGEVENAANEMRAAINSALRGTDKKVGPVKEARQGATRSFEEQMAGKTKSEIAAIQKATRAKLSAITKADGLLAMTRRGLASNPTSIDLKTKERVHLQDIARLEDELKRLEELKKKAPRVRPKATPAPATATVPAPTVQKPAAIDTAFLKQWDKMFGKAKSTTLQISANATKALKTIGTVLEALEGLHAKSTFTITPLLSNDAFTAAKTQLSALARLSGKIAAPFSGLNQQQQTGGKKGAKGAKAGTNALMVDVIGNVTAIAPPKTELIVPVVGEMIKLQAKVNEAIPVNVKISSGSVTESIKGMKRPTLPVAVKLIWDKGAIGKQQQLKGIQDKMKPISLTLNIDAAVAKLEEFISLVKANSPQTIALTATGATAGTGGKTGAAAAGKGKGTTGAVPLTPKQYVDKLGQHLGKGFSLPANYATQIADQQRTRAWHLDQMRRDAMAAFAQKTPYELAEEERLRKLAPTSAGTGKGKVVWGSQMPTAAPAKGMKWIANNNLESHLSTEQKQELNRLRGIQAQAGQNLTQTQQDIARSTAKSNARLSAAQAQYNALEQQLAPWRQQMAQLEEMKKPLLSLKKLNAVQKKSLANITSAQVPIAAQISQLSAQQAPFAAAIQHENELMARYNAMANRALAGARQRYSQAGASVGRYTNGWSQVPMYGTPSASNIAKAQQLMTKLHNDMLPFGLNKSQMDMVKKYHRYFSRATSASGITPVAGMAPAQMMQYLTAVSAQMQAANVPVPIQLRDYMNKLDKQMTGGGGAVYGGGTRAARMPHQMSMFDKARKWAYPFTGTTSFGQRTPMAVDMAKGMGVMFAIGGAMSAIGNSFSQAMEYQNTMRTTQAILQNGTDTYSQGSFHNMEEIVREVGVKTKFSAPEVASAARFLAMAGYDISGINAAIRPIADLALIGDSDLGETADKMTNILTTFGINADKLRENPNIIRQYANIMATTATRSNTDLMMLAESAKYGGGVANLYGRNDPNLFADTMALFGVMGNAGIQASSAGTALRMMYQNIFKPNKNQKKVLDMMQSTYGISTINEDGSFRAMSSILTEMAQRIPENRMAEIVGNLFRITAQPGAAATLLAAAGGDQNVANEIGAGIELLSGKMSDKRGMSSLVSLMMANRNSVNGNISGAIAEEKQNTIQGLWAQVTSTFTEGIVKAFEERQGGFETMLKGLRDYLAKPETVTMLQNLLDMVIEIGKVLAEVVALWAKIYSAAPGLIKFWVKWQMIFTQIGSFIAPVVALIGVFNRLGAVIGWLTGVTATGAGSVAARAAGSDAAMMAPLLLSGGAGNRGLSIQGNLAARARQDFANNAMAAQALAMTGGNYAAEKTRLDKATTAHYQAVAERHRRIYSPKNMWKRLPGNMWGGLKSGFFATMSWASISSTFSSMFGGITKLLTGLLSGLAKAVGLLFNPFTLAIGAAAGLGYGIYKLVEHMNGASEAQIASRKKANKEMDKSQRELDNKAKWYQDMLSGDNVKVGTIVSSTDTKAINEYNAKQAEIRQTYAGMLNDFSVDASAQSVADVQRKWNQIKNNNPLYRLAIGNANPYDFSKKHKQMELNPYDTNGSNLGVVLWNLWHADEDKAINQRQGMIKEALMMEGAQDERARAGMQKIAELRQQFLEGKIKESEYTQQANAEKARIMASFGAKLSADNLTAEQFAQSSNRSVYAPYQDAVSNLLTASINGELGTLTGKLNAYSWLSETANKAQMFTDVWYQNIAHIIGDYHVIHHAVTQDGKIAADIEIMLSTLPNGRINFDAIFQQIKAVNTNFQVTLADYTDMIAKVFQMMSETGILEINSKDDLKKMIRNQMVGAKYGETDYRNYWKQYIAKNPNSEWLQAGINEDTYVDFMMGRSGDTIKTSKRTVKRDQEKQTFYSNLANSSATAQWGEIQATKKKVQNAAGNSPVKTPAPTTNTPNTPSPGSQDAYASHYDKSAARPTVVNINIGELAHFDRTAIASSSQERDIMAAVEEKVAESIYRLSMTAFNNIGGYNMA